MSAQCQKSRRPSIKNTDSNRFELIEERSRANRSKVDSPTEIVERIMSDERSEKVIHGDRGRHFTETFVAHRQKRLESMFLHRNRAPYFTTINNFFN